MAAAVAVGRPNLHSTATFAAYLPTSLSLWQLSLDLCVSLSAFTTALPTQLRCDYFSARLTSTILAHRGVSLTALTLLL